MGVVRFCVVFDKPDPIYYPGEMLTGRVELALNSAMKIRGVKLKVKGRAKCQWNESETNVFRKSTETYLKSEQTFVGERGAKLELSAEEYVYPFAVMLPLNAPSSFKSHYGEISYYGKAKIVIPFGFDYKKRTTFTVTSPLNLNSYPKLRTPCMEEKSKKFCCLWCSSGPLCMVVHLPKTGFATSELIPITLEIDNASKVAVYAVYICLKRKIDWIAEGRHKNKEVELQKLRSGGVREGQSQTWSEYFTIPPTVFPNLEFCSIIKISHILHIEAMAVGMHSNLNLRIPIAIGHIPLSEDPNVPIVSLQEPTTPNNISSAPPNTNFSAPNLNSNVEEMPQASSSQAYPKLKYVFGENPSPESLVPVQQSQLQASTSALLS